MNLTILYLVAALYTAAAALYGAACICLWLAIHPDPATAKMERGHSAETGDYGKNVLPLWKGCDAIRIANSHLTVRKIKSRLRFWSRAIGGFSKT